MPDENNFFTFKISIFDIIFAAVITILVPIIYYNYQQYNRRHTLRRLWEVKRDEADTIEISPANSGITQIKNIVYDLEKIETLVANSFDGLDYIIYVIQIRYVKQLIEGTNNTTQILNYLKEWLDQLKA